MPKDRLAAAWPTASGSPVQLSAVILARVAALPAAVQSFLAAASVLGQHAPVSAIVSVARLPDARNEVDAAVAAGLLTEDDSALELAFAHPPYRAAIYADLSPDAALGQKFISFVLSPQGQAIMSSNGFVVIPPVLASGQASLPASLRSLTTPWPCGVP